MEIKFIIGWKAWVFLMFFLEGLKRHLVVNNRLGLDKGDMVWIFDDEQSRAKSVFMLTQQIYLQTSHLK